jgi:hypothetical protein
VLKSRQHEKRREARLLCADLVSVRWTDRFDKKHDETANLEDISDHGICLQTETEIENGTAVEIIAGKVAVRGQVRYCLNDELGRFIGVQLEEDSPWPRESWHPKHLLDPRTLLADKALRSLRP